MFKLGTFTKISIVLLLLIGVCLPGFALTECEEFIKGRKDEEVCLDFMRDSDPLLAAAALGEFLRHNRKDISAEKVVEALKEFVEDGNDPEKAAVLASLIAKDSSDRAEMVQALMNPKEESSGLAAGISTRGAKPGQRLAAAILAFNAIENDLAEEPEKQKKKKGKKRGRKDSIEKGPIAVPAALLEGDDEKTRMLALTAAAYAGDAALEQAVVRIKSDAGGALGAKLLYMARTGMDVSDRIVDYVFRRALEGERGARTPLRPRAGSRNSKINLYELVPPGGCMAVKALAVLEDPKYIPYLQKALFNDDSKVQIEAVRAIDSIWQPESQAVLLRRFADCEWPVAVEICNVLKRRPNKEAVPALVNRLHQEKGYLRQHLVHTLSAIAGTQQGQDAEEWKNWWIKNRDAFVVDAGASEQYLKETDVQDVSIPTVGFFYGLPIYSDHFFYVVDSSKSMKGERIKSLRENMIISIENLKAVESPAATGLAAMRGRGGGGSVFYNIADFGGRVELLDEYKLSSDKRDGVRYTEEMPLTLATRMFDALAEAISIEQADSFYLLSDGAAIAGALQNWDRMIAALRFMARYRPIAVYCVAFSPNSNNERKMKIIAGNHFGLYGTAN